MHRRELVRKMVLNSICDDFENVDQIILTEVAEECGKLGLVIERSEIVSALAGLVHDGLAKTYDLYNLPNPRDLFSGELQIMPQLDGDDASGSGQVNGKKVEYRKLAINPQHQF